jgi:hypothetical protein
VATGIRLLGLTAAFAATMALPVFAADSYLDSLSISNGTASIGASALPNGLPKGWFTKNGAFTRTKTNLRATLDFAGTSCSDAKQSLVVNSTTTGDFTPSLNNGGQVSGYTWDAIADVSSRQNHWYLHQHCDGTTEVHGCADAVQVTMDIVAVDTASGNCQLDGGICPDFPTQTASLPAVQDPDVVDTDCGGGEEGESCGIGPCVSACEQDCNAAYDARTQRDARELCKQACTCECKKELPDTCPPHHECDE